MKTAISALTVLLLSALPTFTPELSNSNSAAFAQTATPTAQKDAGLEFEGFGTPNVGRITDTIFQGECPGEKPGDAKARFYSTATPPGPGRRVVIRNVSRGLSGGETPFTDRAYNEGSTSESTSVAFGTRHELRHFVVLEGQNNLEYEIKQGDSAIVEKGAFTIQMSRSERNRYRNAICNDEKYCQGSENTPLDQCENVRTRSRCYCPDSPSNTFIRR